MIIGLTKSSRDAGFRLIQNNEPDFELLLGKNQLHAYEMNLIYRTEIESVASTSVNLNWETLRPQIRSYGKAGEEIYLRSRAISDLSNQNWQDYQTAAKEYLHKYGDNLPAAEKEMFQSRLKEHAQ
jgi:hypothetical protein